jgi:hypothetical protein
MQNRFATARFISKPALVIVETGSGDYFELGCTDLFHAQVRLRQFAHANALLLTECAGFPRDFSSFADISAEQSARNYCRR